MRRSVEERYKTIRKQLEGRYLEHADYVDLVLKGIDDFVGSSNATDLEKKFYLLLNHFPGETKPYVCTSSDKSDKLVLKSKT